MEDRRDSRERRHDIVTGEAVRWIVQGLAQLTRATLLTVPLDLRDDDWERALEDARNDITAQIDLAESLTPPTY